MKINSIKTRITILFSALLIVLIALFATVQLVYTFGKRHEFFHEVRHLATLLIQESKKAKQNGKNSLLKGDIELIFDDNSLSKARDMPPQQRTHLFDENRDKRDIPPPPIPIERQGFTIKPIVFDTKDAILLEQDGFKCIAIDKYNNKIKLIVWSLFLAVVLTLSALYYFILKSLRPLSALKSAIENFGNGNLQASIKIETNDEIGQIAKAFDDTAKQIRLLIDSKDIFLKNAAHELRTPITKGIITTHLLPTSRDKEILLNVFKRLENISESVIELEHFSSKDFELNLVPLSVTTLIQDATELLFLGGESVHIHLEELLILADSNLMAIVFKNLIDNGVKFSHDNEVSISTDGKLIIFKNSGAPLEEPIERYFEPFFKETSIKNAKGSGLGLFLAKKIANAHGLDIKYKYEDGYNCFILG